MTVSVELKEAHLSLPKLVLNIKALINGKPVRLDNLHASITSNGFNHFAQRTWNDSEAQSTISYILFSLSYGDETGAVTYTWDETNNLHQVYHYKTATNSGDWTGGALLTENDTTPEAGDIIASATWTAVAHNANDSLHTIWEFGMAGSGWSSGALWYWLGTNAYRLPFQDLEGANWMALVQADDSTEFMREKGTFTRTSDTVSYIENVFTPASTVTDIRYLYILAGSTTTLANAYYKYDFGENKIATNGVDVTVKATQTLL